MSLPIDLNDDWAFNNLDVEAYEKLSPESKAQLEDKVKAEKDTIDTIFMEALNDPSLTQDQINKITKLFAKTRISWFENIEIDWTEQWIHDINNAILKKQVSILIWDFYKSIPKELTDSQYNKTFQLIDKLTLFIRQNYAWLNNDINWKEYRLDNTELEQLSNILKSQITGIINSDPFLKDIENNTKSSVINIINSLTDGRKKTNKWIDL